MHLAVAVQTYTIALFGPARAAKLLPASDRFLRLNPRENVRRFTPRSSGCGVAKPAVFLDRWGAEYRGRLSPPP